LTVLTMYGGETLSLQVRPIERQNQDIICATPGRLLDAVDNGKVSLMFSTVIVLDEADQMLDMGFEKDIRKLVDRCPATGTPEESGGAGGELANTKRQTLFFTATWPKKVQSAAASLTSRGAVQVRIAQGSGGDKLTLNKAVTQEVIVTEWRQKASVLKKHLETKFGAAECAIVFAGTKSGCDKLEKSIWESCPNIWCRAIHGDKEQWQREEILGKFRANVKAGQQAVLVATDVAARGLDIPGISLVVVHDFSSPNQPPGLAVENFVHRVGRTGRGGKTGRALTLWTSDDKGAPELVKLLETAGQEVPEELREMAERERPSKGKGKGGKGKGGKGKGKSKGKGGKSWGRSW